MQGIQWSFCVCMSVCMSVTVLATTYLVYMSGDIQFLTVKICTVWTSLKTFRLGDMA